MILVYIANKKGDRIGGIVTGRDSTEAYTNAQKEVAKRGADARTFLTFSV